MPKDKLKTEYISGKRLNSKKRTIKISLKLVSLILILVLFIAIFIFALSSKVKNIQIVGNDNELNNEAYNFLQKYEGENYFFTFSSNVELELKKQFEGIAIISVDKKFPDIIIANVTKREVIAKIICQNYSALLGSEFDLTNIVQQPNFALNNNLANSIMDQISLENIDVQLPLDLTNSNNSTSLISTTNSQVSSSINSSTSAMTSSESIETKVQKFKAQEILKLRRNMYFDFFSEMEKLDIVSTKLDTNLPTIYCLENLTKIEKFKSLLVPSSEILQIGDKLIIKSNEKIYIYSLSENLEIQNIRLNSVKEQILKEGVDFKQIDLRENKVIVY